MAGLLSDEEDREIRDAIRLVTDTFMVTPVNYYIGGDSIDRWQEDREDKKYYEVPIEALKEDMRDDIEEDLVGSLDLQNTKLTFNLEYLQEKGLITTDFKVVFNPTRDYFKVKGLLYKVKDVYYDGPLSMKDCLIIVVGELMKNSNMAANVIAVSGGFDIPIEELVGVGSLIIPYN